MRVEKINNPPANSQEPTPTATEQERYQRLTQMLRQSREDIQTPPLQITPPGLRRPR